LAGSEEERKKRREEKRRRGREERRERERERESKGRQKREVSIPHFLRKRNYALSPLLIEERERGEGLKRQK
jgi:hypothetical protein